MRSTGTRIPKIMGIGPVGAEQKVLEKTNLTLNDIDLLEVNKVFAAQTLAAAKELKWDGGYNEC